MIENATYCDKHVSSQKCIFCSDDGDEPKLRHLADASQWRALNAEFEFFTNDPRNIVLGASSDGMNPFGNQNTNHSTWPVFVWMYNLPPGCA